MNHEAFDRGRAEAASHLRIIANLDGDDREIAADQLHGFLWGIAADLAADLAADRPPGAGVAGASVADWILGHRPEKARAVMAVLLLRLAESGKVVV